MTTGFHRRSDFESLSNRQREVLALIAKGRTNGEIATELGIGFESVKSHVSGILSRLDVSTREEAAEAWKSPRRRVNLPGWLTAPLVWKTAAAFVATIVVGGTVAAVMLSRSGQREEPSVESVQTPAAPVLAGMQPGATADWQYQPGDIHEARLDLASRLGAPPLDVHVREMKPAGWDACLGAYHSADQGCNAPLILGHIVDFEVAGLLYRYHVGGMFVALDWALNPVIDDGQSIIPRLDGVSGDMSRPLRLVTGEVALRTNSTADEWRVVQWVPALFEDSCLGFRSTTPQYCDPVELVGSIVDLEREGVLHRVHVSLRGVVAVDLVPGTVTIHPDPDIVALQQALRDDVAQRLSISVDGVEVAEFRAVWWSNRCWNVVYTGEDCPPERVPGFVATFSAGGHEYAWRYHASVTGEFRAAMADDVVMQTMAPEGYRDITP